MAKCLDIRDTDNLFVERLWRTAKHEEMYLKAYADWRQALRDQRYLVYHSTMLPTAFENQGSVS